MEAHLQRIVIVDFDAVHRGDALGVGIDPGVCNLGIKGDPRPERTISPTIA